MALVNGIGKTGKKPVDTVENFLQSVFDLTVREVLRKGKNRDEPVVRFQKPEDLKKILKLNIQDEPQSEEVLLQRCKDILKYSVKTGQCINLV